jgi:hypothetical protein
MNKIIAKKQAPRKKSGHGSRLDLHFLIGGKTVCAAEYRLTADSRFIEIPFPISRLLSTG